MLRAPDGAGWWWNGATLLKAERALLDLNLCDWKEVSGPAQALDAVRLWKLLFAFYPDADSQARSLPVAHLECLILDWACAQPRVRRLDQSCARGDATTLSVMLELLASDESQAAKQAAARCLAHAAPALCALTRCQPGVWVVRDKNRARTLGYVIKVRVRDHV